MRMRKLFQFIFMVASSASLVNSFSNDNFWGLGIHNNRGVHIGLENVSSFLNEWTVEVDGDEQVAQLVALELGYAYGGPILGFPKTFTFVRHEHEMERRTPGVAPSEHTSALVGDRRVKWAEQLFEKFRVKRYPTPNPDEEVHRVKRIRELGESPASKRREKPLFNDELWDNEWYLQDTRTAPDLPRLDLNVLPVYAMGYNGKGIRVSVLDDGIEYNHTDLRANYDPEISWDCNDRDADPAPRYDRRVTNSHGTRCAGEIAMTANNMKCGVGVAWGASIGGVRMLDGRITDRIEGEALGFGWDKVDIYSASWGPSDDGRTVEGPGRLAAAALHSGVTQGRGGRGAIYVWANGNGGGNGDNCNCDGYSSSIYTISIGSASQHGLFPWYGEICSSTLAAAYSSGAYTDQKVASTDIGDSCTLGHTGTSAAAPLAAGILALALQANPELTWRDVQHLIAWTSEYAPLSSNPGWQVNGVGLYFDVRFGFGLLNAEALVKAAINWTTLPEKFICSIDASPVKEGKNKLQSKSSLDIVIPVDKNCSVKYLEHVQLIVNIKYSRRGALEVTLLSPQGTRVQVLSARPRDTSMAGFVEWPLTSVGTWGEDPTGAWRVTISDNTNEENAGEIGPFTLVLHGTSRRPAHMGNGRRYNYDFDVYRAFVEYSDSGQDSGFDDQIVLGDYKNEEPQLSVLDQVENELQRYHHYEGVAMTDRII